MVVEDKVVAKEIDLTKGEEVDRARLMKVTQTFGKKTKALEEPLEEWGPSMPNKVNKTCP